MADMEDIKIAEEAAADTATAETAPKPKRTRAKRRSREELLKELDAKIAYHEQVIAKLQVKREKMLHPTKNMSDAQKVSYLLKEVEKAGMDLDDIMRSLGIDSTIH